jgi:hypothetical protein
MASINWNTVAISTLIAFGSAAGSGLLVVRSVDKRGYLVADDTKKLSRAIEEAIFDIQKCKERADSAHYELEDLTESLKKKRR